ncbi:glycosyltransferase family 61 protein [Rickettsiaceae bacterium]|nr:glycosyltransferase family 61 protein [Rickettsiaceae bacterium]
MNLYRKLTLANLLNWFAVRLVNFVRRWCAKIICVAIRIDPSRQIYRSNLRRLGYSDPSCVMKPGESIMLPFYNFKEAVKFLKYEISILYESKTLKLRLPIVINQDLKVPCSDVLTMQVPEGYLVAIDNVHVFADTDLIIHEKVALYDEIDKSNVNRYGIKSPIIKKVKENNLIIKKMSGKIIAIDRAIHLLRDHSKNYFHWLVENLPRLLLTDNIDDSVPILLEEGLPQQFYDALNIMNLKKRKIIYLKKNAAYKVKKLYYPSSLSIVHDNYGKPLYNKDSIYSDDGILYLRNNVLKSLSLEKQQKKRRIFISRKNSDYRQLINTTQVEELLISRGFEILFPENLSFISQVKLFAQAEIIIGQSGAGMTNFVFADPKCRIIMMVSNAPSTNLYLFGNLASALGMNIEYLIGKHFNIRKKCSIHADFSVDTNMLTKYLNKIGIE